MEDRSRAHAHLGVDFDNTIVCYDELFWNLAVERDLIPTTLARSKQAVRLYLVEQGNEDTWTELQGIAYGERILEAAPFAGARDTLAACARAGVTVSIISHKTAQPYRGRTRDLREAARHWLEHHEIVAPSGGVVPEDRVFFELTKTAKLDRIFEEGCTHFVDDLPEFLGEPSFPPTVERILFDPRLEHDADERWVRAEGWCDVPRLLGVGAASDGGA